MKKIYTLALALTLAMTSFAQIGFDYRNGGLGAAMQSGDAIYDYENITIDMTEEGKYSIKVTSGSYNDNGECSFVLGGITFWYKNSADGTVAWKTYNTYIQPNGKERKIVIPVSGGQEVKIYVQDSLEGVGLEGATVSSIDLVAWGTNKDAYTSITAATDAEEIVLWSDDRSDSKTAKKFKLGAVVVEAGGEAAGVAETTGMKAYKVIENGQLIIIKNGVRYNALGTKL